MTKRKTAKPDDVAVAVPAEKSIDAAQDAISASDQVAISNLSLHELFDRQVRDILDGSDLDEEQKQNILVAMSCPCCGGGAFSYTTKIRRRS
jgi:hypothetical protein